MPNLHEIQPKRVETNTSSFEVVPMRLQNGDNILAQEPFNSWLPKSGLKDVVNPDAVSMVKFLRAAIFNGDESVIGYTLMQSTGLEALREYNQQPSIFDLNIQKVKRFLKQYPGLYDYMLMYWSNGDFFGRDGVLHRTEPKQSYVDYAVTQFRSENVSKMAGLGEFLPAGNAALPQERKTIDLDKPAAALVYQFTDKGLVWVNAVDARGVLLPPHREYRFYPATKTVEVVALSQ